MGLTAPDVVVACYGMNDGIYHPFAEQRFEAFRERIRKFTGAERLAGATVVLLTPPPFDAVAAKANVVPADSPQFGYRTP